MKLSKNRMEFPKPIYQLRNNSHEVIYTAEKYGVSNIRVFGSVIRNEATPSSDIDLLIHIEENSGLFNMNWLNSRKNLNDSSVILSILF